MERVENFVIRSFLVYLTYQKCDGSSKPGRFTSRIKTAKVFKTMAV